MGFEEPTQKGAIGYYEAIKNSVKRFVDWNEVLPLVSSIAADGASVNIGKKMADGLFLNKEETKCLIILALLSKFGVQFTGVH